MLRMRERKNKFFPVSKYLAGIEFRMLQITSLPPIVLLRSEEKKQG